MTAIAIAFSLFIVALGILGLVSPSRLLGLDRFFQTPAGLYLAAGFRMVMGVVLLMAALASRAPDVLRVIGVVFILAGVITVFLGFERFRGFVDWWSAHGSSFARVWAVVALALGLSLVYVLVP